MEQRIEHFRTHNEFYTYVSKFLPKLDVKISVSRSRFTFKHEEDIYAHSNLLKQLVTFNDLMGVDLFILEGSRPVGRSRYNIYINTEIEGAYSTPKEVSEVEETESEVIVPVEEENVSQEPTELISTEVTSELEDTLEVDWDWVDSLEDSKENRLALDEYAEKFSVPLKRTMKVENMAKKFKEALA